MKHVAQLPGCHEGAWDRWSSRPLDDLERFLQGLQFDPVRACLLLQGDYYPAAKLLGLEVPTSRLDRGEVEIESGRTATYDLGSIDGRSTDYLSLTFALTPASADTLKALLDRLASVMAIGHRRDLQIFVESEQIQAD